MANTEEELFQLNVSVEEKDKLVSEVVRYVLFKTHQSYGCPIKREDLTQLVTKNYRQRSLPAIVINEAREKLSSIFGYEMRELHRLRPSSANQGRNSQQQGSTDAKSYVLISKLPEELYRKFVVDSNSAHLSGFTFVIVSIVQLAGGRIPEENLWIHMKQIGLSDNEENHPVLGNIKQALESILQQRYLQKVKVNAPEGNILYYELAERALHEDFNKKLKEYVSQIVKKDADSLDAE